MFKRISCVLIVVAVFVSAFSVMSNALFISPKFDVSMDEQTRELCEMVNESSYIDLENIVSNLPDLSAPVKLLHTVFFLDNGEFSKAMYALRDNCYSNGQITLGKIFYFIGAYYKGFEKCEISLQEQEGGYLEFILDVSYADGEKTSIHSGAYYNPETGLFYGKEDKGMFEIGYNFDINEMVVYATVNSWMRQFGFCLEYDILAYTTPFYFYHTRRFKFFYEGKEWMVQAWKGMYVAANGAEVGVYNRQFPTGTFYNSVSDDEMLKMSFELYHGEEFLFARPEGLYWWVNGFQLSKDLYSARELTLRFTVEMKDAEMLKAFTRAVDFNIWHDVSYTVDGLTVSLVW